MEIHLQRKNDNVHFEAVNEQGNIVQIDGSAEVGGVDAGARPMQLILMGLGGCSGIDIVSILKKQRQTIEDFKIAIDGQRVDAVPAVFETINVIFKLSGPIDPAKAQKAVSLSMEKYCSVTKMLEPTVQINWNIELNGEKLA